MMVVAILRWIAARRWTSSYERGQMWLGKYTMRTYKRFFIHAPRQVKSWLQVKSTISTLPRFSVWPLHFNQYHPSNRGAFTVWKGIVVRKWTIDMWRESDKPQQWRRGMKPFGSESGPENKWGKSMLNTALDCFDAGHEWIETELVVSHCSGPWLK